MIRDSDFFAFGDAYLTGVMKGLLTPSTGVVLKRVYDPEQYDLVPKRSYTEKRIKEKEQELLSLGERRKNLNRQLNEEEKTLKLEIDQLKQKLTP